jgi:hypothetical protein
VDQARLLVKPSTEELEDDVFDDKKPWLVKFLVGASCPERRCLQWWSFAPIFSLHQREASMGDKWKGQSSQVGLNNGNI